MFKLGHFRQVASMVYITQRLLSLALLFLYKQKPGDIALLLSDYQLSVVEHNQRNYSGVGCS